jgi:hypothetical protein
MSKALSLSGNVRIDLVRVERAQPRRIARELIERNEPWSASLPLVAAALLAPLGLHFLAWLSGWLFYSYSVSSVAKHVADFDAWIAMSAPIAGIAHVVLAALAALFGMRLPEKSTADLRAKPSREGWYALGITAVAGIVPGVLLILIPPLLIGFTGLLFIPLSFHVMTMAIIREREIVDSLDA